MSAAGDRLQILLPPGHVRLAPPGTLLYAVLSSTAAVALYDPQLQRGGMAHWAKPYRRGAPSTPVFAGPALVGLARMFDSLGSSRACLQAHLFGGAENPASLRHVPGLSRDNVAAALELLAKLGLEVVQQEVGGVMGRKVVFDSSSGQSLVAEVEKLRAGDWYPELPATERAWEAR